MDRKPNKVIAVIQSRLSSSRLPGKVLKNLADKPMIWHIYNRLKYCKNVDKIIVATSDDNSDNELAEYCIKNKMELRRGNLNNVLSRYLDIINEFEPQYVVRISGDCPLIYPEFIDDQVSTLTKYDADFIILNPATPVLDGQGVIKSEVFKKINKYSKNNLDLEHAGSVYISENLDKFKIIEYKVNAELIDYNVKLSIDYIEDYILINKLYCCLWKNNQIINIYDALKFLRNHYNEYKIQESEINKQVKVKLAETAFIPCAKWEFQYLKDCCS